MKVYKKVIMLIFVLVIMISTGCADNSFLINSSVAALSTECYISVNKDGTVNAVDKTGEFGFDFSDWKGIKSVSAGLFYCGGVKDDGSVVMMSYPGFEDISGWRNIKMLEFTDFAAFGLNEDGTVIQSGLSSPGNDYIKEQIHEWRDVNYIDATSFGIIGVMRNGKVKAAINFFPDLEQEVREWDGIKTASISTGLGRARIVGVKYNGDFVEAHDEISYYNRYHLDSYDELKGAVKIYAGDRFTAGLMPDGTLRVICGDDYDYQAELQKEGIDYIDIKPFDNTKDVADINCCDELLVVLKKDGSVLVGGFFG